MHLLTSLELSDGTLKTPNVSTHFIITAIIVKEPDLEGFTQKAEALRKKHFQTGFFQSKYLVRLFLPQFY